MNTVKRDDWKKRLEEKARIAREEAQKESHPLAAMNRQKTPANVLASGVEETKPSTPLPEEAGMGGGKKEDAYLVPSELRDEAAATRAEMKEQADKRTEAGEAEREAANKNSAALYDALLAFSEKQDGRYDELLSAVKADDYRSNAGAREVLYEYLRGGETAAGDTLASLAGENGGNVDSYARAMAGRTKAEYGAAGDAAAREYYGDYLDRILRVLQASGSDMNDLFGSMQDNVDTAQKVADNDLSIGSELLEALADAQAAERKIEADGHTEAAKLGNNTHSYEIAPMRLDKEYEALLKKNGGDYSEGDALMLLWDKYPSMRPYIMEKYTEFKKLYGFEE